MGKNNRARNNNNNRSGFRPQTQAAQPVSVTVKKDEELTSEEKERLKTEGEEEKTKRILEGEEEKKKLILEGEEEKKKLISEAAKEWEKRVEEGESYVNERKEQAEEDAKKIFEKTLEKYRIEVRDQILKETENQRTEILASAEDIRTAINREKEEIDAKQEEIDGIKSDLYSEYDALAGKKEQLVKDTAELESRKLSYKAEVLEEVGERTKETARILSELEEEKKRLEKTLKNRERELAASNEDKDFYMGELDKAVGRKTKLMQAEHEAAELKAQVESLDKLYRDCKAENERYYEQLLQFGSNPAELIDERNKLKEENRELRNKLTACPGNEEIVALRKTAEEYEKLSAEAGTLKKERIESERQLQDLDVYKNDLENSRRFIRVLELQRSELQRELDRIQENYNSHEDLVFAGLSAIDGEPVDGVRYDSGRSLKEICAGFRNYLASRPSNRLYYSEASVRTFFAGLASSRILILQGMSGTGKSSLPKAFADYMGSVTDRIEVQSSWKDRNDLLGFYNDFEKRYKETKFLESLYRATRDRNNIHLIMLDEMNLSRIEYYFADFLSVLEEDDPQKWRISLVSRDVKGEKPNYIQNGELSVGENTWFVGTANKDDSTFTITDKVYDRAIVLNFEERAKKFTATKTYPRSIGYAELKKLLDNATVLTHSMESDIEEIVGWLDENMKCRFEISFGNRISKQINKFVPAYVKCGGELEEAIDIIFSSKILRKLQGYYDESTKKGLGEFLTELKSDPRGEKLLLTRESIQKMIDRI